MGLLVAGIALTNVRAMDTELGTATKAVTDFYASRMPILREQFKTERHSFHGHTFDRFLNDLLVREARQTGSSRNMLKHRRACIARLLTIGDLTRNSRGDVVANADKMGPLGPYSSLGAQALAIVKYAKARAFAIANARAWSNRPVPGPPRPLDPVRRGADGEPPAKRSRHH